MRGKRISMRKRWIRGAVALAALTAWAPPASAGIVGPTAEGFGFTDTRGERNVVTITVTGSEWRAHDAAAPLETTDPACRSVDAQTVACEMPGLPTYNVVAGGGDDVIEVASGTVPNTAFLSGGDGADRIVAGPQRAELDGGAGDDSVTGSGGTDYINGGDGADSLYGGDGGDLLNGGLGPDRMSGGAGSDRVWYVALGRVGRVQTEEPRMGPVLVDPLTAGGDGEPGENDDVAADVEAYITGRGNDVVRIAATGFREFTATGLGDDTITGGPGEDFINPGGGSDRTNGGAGDDWIGDDSGTPGSRYPAGLWEPPPGWAGDDVLVGGEGDDRLEGGGGRDRLSGGTGRDYLNGVDAFARVPENVVSLATGDDLVCGPGYDLADADALDAVAPDCEEVRGPLGELKRLLAPGGVVVPVQCQPGAATACAGTVSVLGRQTQRSYGKSRFKSRMGRTARVRVRLSPRLVKRARRGVTLRLRAVVRVRERGRTRAATRKLTITNRP
jgi:Ca2+-binding RTX toxin-like protein